MGTAKSQLGNAELDNKVNDKICFNKYAMNEYRNQAHLKYL
jgi:hypothetical protein